MPATLQPPIIFPSDIYFRDFGLNWADLGVITANPIQSGVYLGRGIALIGDTNRHIWRSADFGATWFDLGLVTLGNTFAFANLGNGIVICGDSTHRCWRSTDYGFTWAAVTPFIPLEFIQSMAYLGDGIAIFGQSEGRVYRSVDYGATWVNLGVIAAGSIGAMAYLGNGIAIMGDNGGHVFRSVDHGATWNDLDVIATNAVAAMAYLGNGKAILGDFNGHIFRSVDSVDYGATWNDLGVIGGIPLSMTLLVDGIAVFGDNNNHVFRSINYGATWTDLGVITTNDITTIFYLDNGIAILGDVNNHIFRSVSAFETWKQFENSDRSCRVWNSVVQNIPQGVWTALNFNTVIWNTDDIFNVVNPTRLTCRTAGKYWIGGGLYFDLAVNSLRGIYIRLNGATILVLDIKAAIAGIAQKMVGTSMLWEMAVNDFVEVMVYHTQAGVINTRDFYPYSPWFAIGRVP